MDRIPEGAISIVSDSYNIWEAVDKIWGKALKDMVIERGQRGGRIVIRPDSGKPEEVVVKVNAFMWSSKQHTGDTVIDNICHKDISKYMKL